MSVATRAIATAAVGEIPAKFVCEVLPGRFAESDASMAARMVQSMGDPACFQQGNTQLNLFVYVDRELEDIDGSMVTSAGIPQYRVTFLNADIPNPRRGDKIITHEGTFQLEDRSREADDVETTFTASKIA